MTPEKQQIAIAKACGWLEIRRDSMCNWIGDLPNSSVVEYIPRFTTDLNACHEMEKVLDDGGLWKGYCNRLWEVVCPQFEQMSGLNAAVALLLLHATAAQRCEAFLKTLGLWR